MLNLDNYKSVFAGYNQDILDEVRSSILDGVDLTPYITDDKNQDPYYLQQVRVSLKENIDEPWLKAFSSGDLLRQLRKLYNDGINLDYVNKYIRYKLPESYYRTLVDIISSGVVIPDNFSLQRIPSGMLPVVRQVLQSGNYNERFLTTQGSTPNTAIVLSKLNTLVISKGWAPVTDSLITRPLSYLIGIYERFTRLDASIWSIINLYADAMDNDISKLDHLLALQPQGTALSELVVLPEYQLASAVDLYKKGCDIVPLISKGALTYQEVSIISTELLISAYDV